MESTESQLGTMVMDEVKDLDISTNRAAAKMLNVFKSSTIDAQLLVLLLYRLQTKSRHLADSILEAIESRFWNGELSSIAADDSECYELHGLVMGTMLEQE